MMDISRLKKIAAGAVISAAVLGGIVDHFDLIPDKEPLVITKAQVQEVEGQVPSAYQEVSDNSSSSSLLLNDSALSGSFVSGETGDGSGKGIDQAESDPVISNSASDPSIEEFRAGIDLNTASQAMLETLSGIGPGKAKAIIEYRNKYGGFVCVDELTQVKGIGEKTLEKIKGDIYVSERKTGQNK